MELVCKVEGSSFMVIITVIMVIVMVLCLGISLHGRKMSESQTGRQVVKLSGCQVVKFDSLGHAEQLLFSSSAPYPVSLEFIELVPS